MARVTDFENQPNLPMALHTEPRRKSTKPKTRSAKTAAEPPTKKKRASKVFTVEVLGVLYDGKYWFENGRMHVSYHQRVG